MLWIKLKRVLKSGFVSFWRNSFVSLASIMIMVVTLFMIALLIFGSAILDSALVRLQEKVDVNVYFLTSAPESDVLAVESALEALPEVASVEYISRDQALAGFRERHANDQLTLQALDELGENPFGASLNILAKETSQYEGIAKFLEGKGALSQDGTTIIDKVNYAQNKVAIDKLSGIMDAARAVGLVLVGLFALISILISFNTIQIVIYTAREEISLMRLVGASSMYVRGPFIVSGMMYGVVAGTLTLLLLIPFVWWLGPAIDSLGTGVRLAEYYRSNVVEIFAIVWGTGIILGAISSYLAVKKFLKV